MMNCLCAICCSRLESSDDIFSTNCGHIFHFPCLTQWLERSKTCPQCREKTNSTKIHRLYFNISNNDTIKEDSSTLQERIDNLKFQMLLRDKDITDYKSKASKLQTQMLALRSEVLKLESEMEHKNSAINALKQQTKCYKQMYDENKKYKEQVEILKDKLNNFEDIQTLLSSTNDEANELISCTNDPNKLATYISALKRELTIGLNNRKEYRMMIKQLKQDLNKKIIENNNLKDNIKKLKCIEEVVQRLESENLNLKMKFNDKTTSENETNINTTIRLSESPKTNIVSAKLLDNKLIGENEENLSVNPRFKIQNLVSDNKRKITRLNSGNFVSNNSILAKKPRLTHDTKSLVGSRDETYVPNGLGGFAKIDNFPVAINGGIKKKIISSSKTRSIQSSDLQNQNKIDSFVDLT